MSRLSRLFRKVVRVGVIALAATQFSVPVSAQQQPKPIIVSTETNRIHANGDAQFRGEMVFPKEIYAALKKSTPDPVHLLQKLGIKSEESVTEGVKASWSDSSNGIKYEVAARGHARIGKDGTWGTPVPDGVMVSIRKFENGVAVLEHTITVPGLGRITGTATVTFPTGASDLKLSRDKTRLTYHLPQLTTEGTQAKHEFDVDAKKHVLASLAKVMGNRKFGQFWTTRSVFKNTGDQVLKDYRVRFRLTDYTATWSPWAGTPLVVPGQTVVDTYFPALDLEKVGKLTGQTRASVEIQFEYTRADGKKVEDTDTKELTLLSRNQVQYSSMSIEEVRDFGDNNDLTAIVLACFVTHEDPVIQQAAGRICKAAGGFNAAGDDESAIKFLAAAYDFMAANIAYQTPPGAVADRKLVQHVKYGRDVLKNKAGTCIDLAILYGSLCEAVGLEPVLFGTANHCFPGVILPVSKKLITVESTLIGKAGFVDAVNHSTEKNMKSIQSGETQAVSAKIVELHGVGFHPIDLPTLADDVLDKWGMSFDAKPVGPKLVAKTTAPLGLWRTTFRIGQVAWVQTTGIDADGQIASKAVSSLGFEVVRMGTFKMKGNKLTVMLTDGTSHTGTIKFNGPDEFVFDDDNGPTLVYKRLK